MKKLGIFIVLWLLLLSLVYLLHSEDQQKAAKPSTINTQINNIVKLYGDRAFKAFYSIEELRPYSIVQIDQICDIYDNNWLSPNTILTKLDNEDKQFLTKSVAEYIGSFNDPDKEKYLLLRIVNWCKADMQFSFINDGLGIYQENIVQALHNVNKVNQNLFDNNIKADGKNEISGQENDYTYYQTLNLISNMKTSDQMKFYGDIYYQLASMLDK
ncbi:MAG: hypothetical protein V1779_15340 [bacterium]